MNGQMDDLSPAELPGCAAAALALGGATVPVAVGLSFAMGWPSLFLPIFIVSLAIVALFGSLGFMLIRERISVPRVVMAGFATGAVVPVLGILMSLGDGTDVTDLLEALGYGVAGAMGAVIAWLLLAWQMRDALAEKFIAGIALLSVLLLTLTL